MGLKPGGYGSGGTPGPPGTPGQGVPIGGTAAQELAKIDGVDYNTHWITPSGGGGGAPDPNLAPWEIPGANLVAWSMPPEILSVYGGGGLQSFSPNSGRQYLTLLKVARDCTANELYWIVQRGDTVAAAVTNAWVSLYDLGGTKIAETVDIASYIVSQDCIGSQPLITPVVIPAGSLVWIGILQIGGYPVRITGDTQNNAWWNFQVPLAFPTRPSGGITLRSNNPSLTAPLSSLIIRPAAGNNVDIGSLAGGDEVAPHLSVGIKGTIS